MTRTGIAALPMRTVMLYLELSRRLRCGDDAPGREELGDATGLSLRQVDRATNDLRALGALSTEWIKTKDSNPRRRFIFKQSYIAKSGKAVGRCEVCGGPCTTGRWCAAHRQIKRKDRAWVEDAVAIFDEVYGDLTPGADFPMLRVYLRITKKWPHVTLWDRSNGETDVGKGHTHIGLVSALLRERGDQLGPEWRTRRKGRVEGITDGSD